MERPSEARLSLVAQHGSGPIERALAIVILAKSQGREDELQRLLDESDTEAVGRSTLQDER